LLIWLLGGRDSPTGRKKGGTQLPYDNVIKNLRAALPRKKREGVGGNGGTASLETKASAGQKSLRIRNAGKRDEKKGG